MIYAEVKSNGILNQVWKNVNDLKFNPPLLPGSNLISFPDDMNVHPGMLWDGMQLLPPPKPSINSIKSSAKQKVLDYALSIENELTAGYTPGEVASWSAKLEAAYAYVAGNPNSAQKIMIETEANEKGIAPLDLCNLTIIPKGEWYSEATALIASLRSNTYNAIDAATIEAEVDQILTDAMTLANQKWIDLISRMP